MNEFRKYMHLERFGNEEVEGIELGTAYIFPKIDGTNASAWLDSSGSVCAGSRNRELSIDEDNAGFCAYIHKNDEVKSFLRCHPSLTLYGEWLVPHTLKTYRDDAWRKFYVFDVYDSATDSHLSFEAYSELLERFEIEYLSPLSIITNASRNNLIRELDKNDYLICDGEGTGEGVVIKNYQYQNKYGRVTWAKLVRSSFKEKHKKAMGVGVIPGDKMIEAEIATEYVDDALVNKVHSKIVVECDGWSSKFIPRLLSTVFYDLINEELWNITKRHKNPVIDFGKLYGLTVLRVKEAKPELF